MHLFRLALPAAAFAMVASAVGFALAQGKKIEVLGLSQAAPRITSATGKVIMIDPFLKRNPKTPARYNDLKALGKVEIILVTHGHFDHMADAAGLSKLTEAKVVGSGVLARARAAYGMIDKTSAIAMNKGGTITPLGPGIKIGMVPDDHSSAMGLLNPFTKRRDIVYAGAPVGYVIELENGFKIYHSGETNMFADMALIGKLYPIDLAMMCIGGHFTMDPRGAAYAARELLKPKTVLPIHYGTFPPLKGTPAQLKQALGQTPIKVLNVQPGQAAKF